MRKLSKEDIVFIDTYLKNSDIEFTDIRTEMVDHIASEIENRMNNGDEREFYYVFKDFMVVNKRKLLRQRKAYCKVSDRKIGRMLLKKVVSFQSLIIFLNIFFSFNLIERFFGIQTAFKFIKYLPLVFLILVFLIYFQFISSKKERYSSVERIGLYFSIIGQIINLILINIKIETWAFYSIKTIASLIILFIILLTAIAFELKKEYQLKYKSVA